MRPTRGDNVGVVVERLDDGRLSDRNLEEGKLLTTYCRNVQWGVRKCPHAYSTLPNNRSCSGTDIWLAWMRQVAPSLFLSNPLVLHNADNL